MNEIYEAQLMNDAQEVSPTLPKSPIVDSQTNINNEDEMVFDGAGATDRLYFDHASRSPDSRPSEHQIQQDEQSAEEVQKVISEQHSPFLGNIISVINNDKLYYIANDATTS